MRIYYKKKFWAGVGALLLGLALPGTCLFVGWITRIASDFYYEFKG